MRRLLPCPAAAWTARAVLVALLAALVAPGAAGAGRGPLGIRPYQTGSDRGFGAFAYAVDEEGTLWLALSLRGAAPGAEYEVSLVCGPTVAESCGYAAVGLLATDRFGDADSAEIPVGVAVLEVAPFGAGERLDHLSLVDWSTGAAYVGDPFGYGVP